VTGKARRATQTAAAEMYPYNQTQRVLKNKPLIFARTGRRAQQTAAARKMIKRVMMKKKGKVEKWSLQVEKSPHLRASSLLVPILVVVIGTYSAQQIPRAPHQIPRTPPEMAADE
jgi:hypothetical protein